MRVSSLLLPALLPASTSSRYAPWHSGAAGVLDQQPQWVSAESAISGPGQLDTAVSAAAGAFDKENLVQALRYASAHPEELAAAMVLADVEALATALRRVAKPKFLGRAGTEPGMPAAATVKDRVAQPGVVSALALKTWRQPESGAFAEAMGIDIGKLHVLDLGWAPWVAAGLALAVFGMFELVHRRWATADLTVPVEIDREQHEKDLHRLSVGVWPLIKPYFFQKSLSPRCYLTALLALGLAELVFNLVFMVWSKDFWDAIEKKDTESFMPIMYVFIALVFTLILIRTYAGYIGMMLVIDWRQFMTHWLATLWLQDKSYYQLQIKNSRDLDNPDQRIQEDVAMFIELSLSLGAGFLESTGRILSMLPVLLVLSPDYAFGVFYWPGWLLCISLLYSGAGTILAHHVGQQLIIANFTKQKYEANFRYNIVQIRDNAESVALWGSESTEKVRLETSFEHVTRVWWLLMLYTKRLGFFSAFYMQTSVTFPYIVLAPNYFKGQITLGTMFMLFNALGSVKGGFDWFILSYSEVTRFRATVDRLQNFLRAMEASPKHSKVERLAEPTVQGAVADARDVSVSVPGTPQAGTPIGCSPVVGYENTPSRVLWRGASLCVQPGEFVLLSAPEGSGKSCFFRALAGIWPRASGQVFLPKGTLFVPQRPYLPQGTLKQVVTYPLAATEVDDEDVRRALRTVSLGDIARRPLEEEMNWALVLSGGEQQRLGFARVLLMKPPLLLLDEATSAMGVDGTMEVYDLLRQEGILPSGAGVVTVSHKVNLLKPLHDRHCKYDSEHAVWVQA